MEASVLEKKKAGGIHLWGTGDPSLCFKNQCCLLSDFSFTLKISVALLLSQNQNTVQEDVLQTPSLNREYGKAGINSELILYSLDVIPAGGQFLAWHTPFP